MNLPLGLMRLYPGNARESFSKTPNFSVVGDNPDASFGAVGGPSGAALVTRRVASAKVVVTRGCAQVLMIGNTDGELARFFLRPLIVAAQGGEASKWRGSAEARFMDKFQRARDARKEGG